MRVSEVQRVIAPVLARHAAKAHVPGNRARELLERAKKFIAHGIGCPAGPGSCSCGAAGLYAAIETELALR